MHINRKSQWDKASIISFLKQSHFPIRLAFCDNQQRPRICSVWYLYEQDCLWAASHKNAFLIKQLKHNGLVSFEISNNDYPYKGVRGMAEVELSQQGAESVLSKLIDKYLADSNSELANWLLSRSDDEVVIRLEPTIVNAWDFSNRMSK